MNREQLVQLRAAIDTLLSWEPAVLDEITRWLGAPPETAQNGASAPQTVSENNGAKDAAASNDAPKANGRDPHPPRTQISRPRPAKRRPDKRKTLEQQIKEALAERPNQSAGELARSVGGAQTTVSRELKRMGERGLIEKTGDGWRLASSSVKARPSPDPQQPSPN